LSIIFIIQFLLFWPIVSESSALFAIDPYLWTNSILYLNENGMINHVDLGYRYPWGFTFFCGGCLLVCPDLITTYFFMKLACFPFLNFYILVMFSISKRIFERPSLILFCLISIFPNTYFLLRVIMFLSSAIPILLILISFIIILTETPNYLLGFIIPATLLFNPVYTLFFILVLIIFYILKIIINFRNFFSVLKEIIGITILLIVFLIPYLINIYLLFDYDLFELIKSFYWLFKYDSSLQINKLIIITRNYILQSLISNSSNLITTDISYYIIELMHHIFLFIFLILFSVFGLFIKSKNKSENFKEFIIFLKIGLIITLFIAFILQLFERNFFFYVFNYRIIEAFYPCIIFLSGLFLEWVLTILDKIWQNRKFNYNNFKEI